MTLKSNTAVSSILKYFSYEIHKYDSGTFTAGTTPSTSSSSLVLGNLSSVTWTSDASPGSASFSLQDYEATTHSLVGTLNVPKIGDEIYIKATSVNSSTYYALFKGFVDDVSHQKTESGSVYSVHCLDMKARLADDVITKTYNEQYDNERKPNFSETDQLLDESSYDVEDIIKDIMDKPTIFTFSGGPVLYFSYSRFDFSEVSDLLDFVPQTLNFDNTSILDAIYQTISSAGTYRMTYDPRDDKIRFTKVSLGAGSAGDLRALNFATADKDTPNEDYVTDNVNVVSDNAVFKTSDIATVYRMYGGEIEWYGGHFVVDPSHASYTTSATASGVYYLTNVNWDGYKYYFATNALSTYTVAGQGQYVLVGCPLYPQWDVTKGYEAYETILPSGHVAHVPSPTPSGLSAYINNTYSGQTERQGYTRIDRNFLFDSKLADVIGDRNYNVALGVTYEAWYPWHGACAYCGGSGAVEDNSAWDGHEEDWFGDSRNDDGSTKRTTLTAFSYNYDSDGLPRNHPVPWKNTCPACRGNGREPKFKITNICNPLVDLPPSKVKVEGAASASVTDRTWSEMTREYAYSYGPIIQIEESVDDIGFAAAKYGSGSSGPEHPLAQGGTITQSKTGTAVNLFPSTPKIYSLSRTQIAPGGHNAKVDYVRGNVIFQDKVGILCKKDMCTIEVQPNGTEVIYIKDSSGKTQYHQLEDDVESFWRPARAWISCYFKRDRFHERFSGVTDNPRSLTISGDTYKVKMSIYNNRPVYEVYKQYSESLELNHRPIIKSALLDEYKWRIYPDDYHKYAVPNQTSSTFTDPSGLLSAFQSKNYYFPIGGVQVVESLTKDEATSAGFAATEVMRSDAFPKKLEWVQRDDRYRLIYHAVRELEKRNDIQITGNIVVRGTNYDLENGMGYVTLNYYGDSSDYNACVVKMVHNFSGEYTTTLELSTEEFRLGSKTEREKDTQNWITKQINKFTFNVMNITSNPGGGARFGRDGKRVIDGVSTDSFVVGKGSS